MEKIFVVKRLARKLWKTEASLDSAMSDAAELLADYLKAHQELKLSTTYADGIQVKLLEAMKAMGEARTALVATHEEMSVTKDKMGVRWTMDAAGKSITIPHFFAQAEQEDVSEAV